MNKKPAQHLVEFLLAAPIIIIFLVFLTEFAYALNTNLTLNAGLQSAVSTLGTNIAGNQTPRTVEENLKNFLIGYLNENKVPNSNSVTVNIVEIDELNSAVFAGYTYIPAFTMPNFFVDFMPRKMSFTAFQLINSALISSNRFSDLSNSDLDKLWGDNPLSIRNGLAINPANQDKVAFLVECMAPMPEKEKAFKMVKFGGDDFISNTVVNLENNSMYVCNESSCTDSNANYLDTLLAVGVSNVYIINNEEFGLPNYNETPNPEVFKKALAFITDGTTIAKGNIDDLDVSLYNIEAMSQKDFKIINKDNTMIYYPKDYEVNFNGASNLEQEIKLGERVNKL